MLSDETLALIEARAADRAHQGVHDPYVFTLLVEEVPALVAEVRRYRKLTAWMESPRSAPVDDAWRRQVMGAYGVGEETGAAAAPPR